MRHQPAVVASLLVSVALIGCGSSNRPIDRPQAPEGAAAGAYSAAPCVHVADDVEYEAECGTVIVPENRNDPGSRLIALPVKRNPSVSESPAEPIFSLAGGPGPSNMGYSRVGWFHDNHDIVPVGYHAVKGCHPSHCRIVALHPLIPTALNNA